MYLELAVTDFLVQASISFSGWKGGRRAWRIASSTLPLPGSLQAWLLSFSLGYSVKINGHTMSWLQFCFKCDFTWPLSCSPLAHLLSLRADNNACVLIFLPLCFYTYISLLEMPFLSCWDFTIPSSPQRKLIIPNSFSLQFIFYSHFYMN